MKILITGANGMLAKSVRKRLEKGNELICTDVADLDITNQEAVLKFVADCKPEYIINGRCRRGKRKTYIKYI